MVTMSTPGHLRASDAEREAAVAHLREHAAAGRLTMDELDERSAAAYAARTLGELASLVADLPAPAPPPAPPRRAPGVRGYGTLPFTRLPDGTACVSPTGAPGEILRWTEGGVELLTATADGLRVPDDGHVHVTAFPRS